MNTLRQWNETVLKGSLLTIKPLSHGHIPDLKKHFSHSLFEFYPIKYADTEDFVNQLLKSKETGTFFPWVFIDNKTQECIGSSSFAAISFEHKRLELGWTWFGEKNQKNGYNVESKLLLLKFLFEQERFNRVELKADALNTASNIAMQKLGFVKEGVFRNHMIMPSGRIRNSIYYSIISDEWENTKAIIEARLKIKKTGQKAL